jgi:hypothetical protein
MDSAAPGVEVVSNLQLGDQAVQARLNEADTQKPWQRAGETLVEGVHIDTHTLPFTACTHAHAVNVPDWRRLEPFGGAADDEDLGAV